MVTAISVLLAWPLAWIIATRVPPRWQRAVLLLAVLPFWTSYVVRSYSWALVLGQQGVLMKALIGLIRPWAGQVALNGKAAAGLPPERVARAGCTTRQMVRKSSISEPSWFCALVR